MSDRFKAYIADPCGSSDAPVQMSWPASAPVPRVGEFLIWREEERWVDDIYWHPKVDVLGTPYVEMRIVLAHRDACEPFDGLTNQIKRLNNKACIGTTL